MALVSVAKPITLNFCSRPIRKGLRRVGFAEGTDVVVEYHSPHSHYEEISSIIDDAVRRGVAFDWHANSTPSALAAKVATETIPIVFGAFEHPANAGLGKAPRAARD